MVAGFASGSGAARRLLIAALDGDLRFLLSTPLLVEYEAVLTRPAVLVSAEEAMAVLDELAGLCAPVASDYRWRPQARDSDDEVVLETAINGGAEVVASFNVRNMQTGARRFGIAVERPGTVGGEEDRGVSSFSLRSPDDLKEQAAAQAAAAGVSLKPVYRDRVGRACGRAGRGRAHLRGPRDPGDPRAGTRKSWHGRARATYRCRATNWTKRTGRRDRNGVPLRHPRLRQRRHARPFGPCLVPAAHPVPVRRAAWPNGPVGFRPAHTWRVKGEPPRPGPGDETAEEDLP